MIEMNYISKCIEQLENNLLLSEIEDNIKQKMLKKISNADKIVLYGASPFAKNAEKLLREKYKKKVEIKDNNVNGGGNSLIFLCSRPNLDIQVSELTNVFNVESYQSLLLMDKDFDSHPYAYTQEKVHLQAKEIIENRRRYLDILDILADEKSKDLLARIILFRLTFCVNLNLNIKTNYAHYFDEDIFKLSNNESFVDAGGYNGDTLKEFLQLTNRKYQKYYLFEPEDSLIENARKVSNDSKINFYKMGLYDEDTKLTFENGAEGLGNGAIKTGGSMSIDVVALDNILKSPVTFIKMDIEGSEEKALIGAKEIIKKYHPKLAICIYHKYDDILTLYNLINELNKYKFYMRAEKDNIDTETYFVCIPI